MTRKRLEPATRREQLLKIALDLAVVHGYQWITRQQIAEVAQCSEALVSHAFGTMIKLKRAVMREAVRLGTVEVIAQGLAEKSPYAQAAPDEMKRRAAQLLTE